jgi:hypothetical protein
MDTRQLSRVIQDARSGSNDEKPSGFLLGAKVVGFEGRDEQGGIRHRELVHAMLAPQRCWHLDARELRDNQRREIPDHFGAELVRIQLHERRGIRERRHPLSCLTSSSSRAVQRGAGPRRTEAAMPPLRGGG